MGRKRKIVCSTQLIDPETLTTPTAIYQSYKGNMIMWYSLPDDDKYRIIEEAMSDLSPLVCIGRCGEDLPDDIKEAVHHLNKCVLSKYYTYIGNAEAFRKLSKHEQRRLAMEATLGSKNAPCLNHIVFECQMKYNHYNALTYHVNRCGLDPERMPWECYRCGYHGNKSEGVEHLKECRLKMKAEAERQKKDEIMQANNNEPLPPKKIKKLPKKEKNVEAQRILQSIGLEVSHDTELDENQPSTSANALISRDVKQSILIANHEPILVDEHTTSALLNKSPVVLPASRGRKSQASVALGVAPRNIRVRSVDGQKRFKFKASSISTAKPDLSDVRDYIRGNYESRFNFWTEMSANPLSCALFASNNKEWIHVAEAHPLFTQWYDRQSVGFSWNDKLPEEQLAERNSDTNGVSKGEPSEMDESEREIGTIPLFGSRTIEFNFDRALLSPVSESSQVTDIYKEILPANSNSPIADYPLVDDLYNRLKNSRRNRLPAQLLFCGGPISAIRTCPQLTKQGLECVAISTFNDERFLVPPNGDSLPTYVQFWVFDSNELSQPAKIWFIMEVPGSSAILDMCWCPLVSADFFSKQQLHNGTIMESQKGKLQTKRLAKVTPEEDTEVLGLLAIATNNGNVLIYRIPHVIEGLSSASSSSSTKFLPSIYSTKPIYIFKHPEVQVQFPEKDEIIDRPVLKKARKSATTTTTEVGEADTPLLPIEARQETSNASLLPFTSIDWSPFEGGRLIAGVSCSGKIYIWDLEAIDLSGPTIVLEIEFGSPPVSIAWMNANEVCVSLRDRILRFYDITTKKMLQEDDTSKTAGAMVTTQLQLLPGVLTYETAMQTHGDITVSVPSYFVNNQENNTIISLPISNSHQLLCTRMRVCGHTGLIASIGADGRLVYSLNGRVVSHKQKEDFSFNMSRTHMQLVRHRSEPLEDGFNEALITHDDCVDGMWLELRLGDGALIDHQPINKAKRKIPEVTLDRRIESLTCMDLSRLTPGLSICGGEAGLVFITPCFL